MEATPRPVLPGDVGPARPGEGEVRRPGRRRRPTPAAAQHPTHRRLVGGRRRGARRAGQDRLRLGPAESGCGGHRVGRRAGAVAGRAAGQAIRVVRIGRVDPAADPGPGRGRHHPPCLRQALRQEPSPRRPLLQARPGPAVRATRGREAVQHRQAAGPAGGLRAGVDAAGRAAQPCQPRPPRHQAEFARLLPDPPRPISIQRWSARRVTLLLLVGAGADPRRPAGLGVRPLQANPGGAAAVTSGSGSCTEIEELWLEAQSVPSASRIPCVQAFPAGVLGTLAVRDGESVLELSHASLDININ
jgi:hypothetical protein